MINSQYFHRISMLALGLALCVVVLGAYTRLTAAGLGCPDWPGCYGHLVLQKSLTAADTTKAWTEMIHRYAAGSLACLIVLLALWRRQSYSKTFIPWFLVALVIFQAALGMWTVTLKLLPIVVMGHLLGGLAIVAGLTWLYCRSQATQSIAWTGSRLQWLALAASIVVFLQIALGGWVSANYAGLACTGFPQCNGEWIPEPHFQTAFQLLPVGENYEGGLLDIGSRITIQWVHRIGAVITLILLLIFARQLRREGFRKSSVFVNALVGTQFLLGILNVIWLLPLPIAVLHHAVAATLLACIIAVNYQVASR